MSNDEDVRIKIPSESGQSPNINYSESHQQESTISKAMPGSAIQMDENQSSLGTNPRLKEEENKAKQVNTAKARG